MREKPIGSFTAKTEKGTPVTVIRYERTEIVSDNLGDDVVSFGDILKLDIGNVVRKIGEREYEVDFPDGTFRLTSDDPNAA